MGFINAFFAWLNSVLAAAGDSVASGVESVKDKADQMTDSWSAYDSLFKAAAMKYGVDWQVMKAISVVESDVGRHSSVARGIQNPMDVMGSQSWDKKSWGIMQITLATARGLDRSLKQKSDFDVAVILNQPLHCIDLSAKLIKENMDSFSKASPDFLRKYVISYNQGAPNTLRGKDYTGDYWEKFLKAYNKVKGG